MAKYPSFAGGLSAGLEAGLNRQDTRMQQTNQAALKRFQMSQGMLEQGLNTILKIKEVGETVPPELEQMVSQLAKQVDGLSEGLGMPDAGVYGQSTSALIGMPGAKKAFSVKRIRNIHTGETKSVQESELPKYFPVGSPAFEKDASGNLMLPADFVGEWELLDDTAPETPAPTDDRTEKTKDVEAYAEALGIPVAEAWKHFQPAGVTDDRTTKMKDAEALAANTDLSIEEAYLRLFPGETVPDARTPEEKKAQAIVAQDPSLKYPDVLKEIVLGKKESDRTKEEKLALALSNADENISFADALKHVTGYDKVEDVPAYSQITLHNPNPPEGEPSWITLDKNTEQDEITRYRKKGYNATSRGIVSQTPGGLSGDTAESKAERDRLRNRRDQYQRARRIIAQVRNMYENDKLILGATGGVRQFVSKKLGGLAAIAELLGQGRVEDFVNDTRQYIANEVASGDMDPAILDDYFSNAAVARNDLDLLDLFHHSMAAIVARARQPTDRILASMLQKAMDDTTLTGFQNPKRVMNIYEALDKDFKHQMDQVDVRLGRTGGSTGPVIQRIFFDSSGSVVGEEGG